MDSVSRYEFHKIFDRVSIAVELAGATTALQIENRLKIEIRRAKSISKDIKDVRLRKLKKHYWSKAEKLDKLQEHDFAGRTIYEANRDTKDIIAQTLLYGRKEAKKRVLAQKRAAVRARWYIKPEEKEVAEKVATGLASREKLRRRMQRYAV